MVSPAHQRKGGDARKAVAYGKGWISHFHLITITTRGSAAGTSHAMGLVVDLNRVIYSL